MGRNLEFYHNKILTRLGKLDHLKSEKLRVSNEISALKAYKVNFELAQTYLQKIAQDTQGQLKFCIEDIVQLALDAVFPNEYKFSIEFEIKRGKTEARLMFKSGEDEIDPIESSGGGVVDIVGFALRISAWTLGHTRNVIALDEPFKHLSNNLQTQGAEILAELSKRLNLQFIIITHRPEIKAVANRVFEVIKIGKEIDGVKYRVSEVKCEN